MAHDPDRTRLRLFSAAVREFSEHGYAGARIERIANEAGVNRERLYANFGSKRALFEVVLAERLASALDAVVVRGEGPDAAAGFACDYFDTCQHAPELARLVAWEGLELQQPIEVDKRRMRASRKVDELMVALPSLHREQVEDLMLTIVTICHAWTTHPNLARIVTGDESACDRRRGAIGEAAAAMATGARGASS